MSATIVRFPRAFRPPPPDYPPLAVALEPWDDRVWLRRCLQQARTDALTLADTLLLLDALAERERQP